MKRHKIKNVSGKNKIFYIHAVDIHGPLPSIEDVFSVEGPDSKEEFEDFRFDDWDNRIMELGESFMENDVLIALTKHDAERLHSILGRVLGK